MREIIDLTGNKPTYPRPRRRLSAREQRAANLIEQAEAVLLKDLELRVRLILRRHKQFTRYWQCNGSGGFERPNGDTVHCDDGLKFLEPFWDFYGRWARQLRPYALAITADGTNEEGI